MIGIAGQRIFELLRMALTGKEIEESLFRDMSDADWLRLLDICCGQGVCAVAFDAIELLPEDSRPSIDVLMEWFGQTNCVEIEYERHLSLVKELTSKWRDLGIRTMVFKGLAHSRYYPKPNHREFGDFDCYQFGDFKKGNETARNWGCEVKEHWYKHSKIQYKELTVENHQYFTAARSSKQAKALNKFVVDVLGDGTYLERLGDTDILLPTLEAEGLFMLHHSLTHFLVEGISLRHFCDWACWIKANERRIMWSSFYEKCKEFKLDGFVDVLNTIAVKYLGVELSDNTIQANSPFVDMTIESVLHDDAAIYSRSKGQWYERFHLIGNAFRYSWKFKGVAHVSLVEYLWGFVMGFIMRGED